MSTPFSRITRSLKAGSLRTSLAGMGIAILLMAVWCIWFFTAEVTICEISRNVRVTDRETMSMTFPSNETRAKQTRRKTVMAEFPYKLRECIRPGQAASLHLERKAGYHTRNIPAVVTKVRERSPKEPIQVELAVQISDSIQLKEGETGQVKIEIEYVSPAVLVMRASKLLADSS